MTQLWLLQLLWNQLQFSMRIWKNIPGWKLWVSFLCPLQQPILQATAGIKVRVANEEFMAFLTSKFQSFKEIITILFSWARISIEPGKQELKRLLLV